MHSRPDAPSTFSLPRVKSIPDTHTHSQPNAPLTSPLPRVKSIPDTYTHSRPDAFRPSLFLHQSHSRRFIGLATAVGRSLIAYLPRLMRLSLSFLALYISVCFSMSHHSLPFVCFLCLILSSPSPSTLVSSIFIPYLRRPSLVIPYISYDPFPIVQINPIITTPRTCINTLSTSCCSSV